MIIIYNLYPVKHIEITPEGTVIATLKSPISTFNEVNIDTTDQIEIDTLESLIHNYGDGAADGWMEGDIFLDDTYELWLDLVKVEFYKNNKLHMLFDDIEDI